MKIPTAEEVRAYLAEIEYPELAPEHFIDFYAQKGWKVGKVPMVDWKAGLRNWKRHRWGLIETKSPAKTFMSLGALQIQLQKVKEEMQQIRNPGGSAYPAPVAPGPRLDRIQELSRLKASIEKRIESALP